MSLLATRTQSLADRYVAAFPRSQQLSQQARAIFPSGITHDLRHLEPFPVYIDHACGSRKWAVDGQELVDYWSGHGALLLGHCHPAVVEAVQQQMERGTHPGACHEGEIAWGRWVQRLIPSAQRVRFTSSGTEATLMALRLARMATGRPRVLKFQGHFHGWHDFLIPGADAPNETSPPPGISPELLRDTVLVPPNDLEEVERTLQADPSIGCVILEPTGGHWGSVPIRGPFLVGLREITRRLDRLLIFDEVITGFRVSPGGAQAHYNVLPDLTTLAKILAGGLPGGCLAGRADLLAGLEFRPGKPKMKHPGTFNANPLSAAAGVATLQLVATGEPSRLANDTARTLRKQLNALFAERGWKWIAYGEFSGFRLLHDYEGPHSDEDAFLPYDGAFHRLEAPRPPRLAHAFRQAMLLHGVDLPGLGGIVTAAHGPEDVERTVYAVAAAVECLYQEGIL